MGIESARVVIGVPHQGTMLDGYFVDTLMALQKASGQYRFVRVANKGVDLARNMLAESVLADPAITHLFFMDADMRFPVDALVRLLQDDKDVIGGTYFSRVIPPIPHVYDFHHEDNPDGTCPLGREHGERGRWYMSRAKDMAAYFKRHPDFAQMEAPISLPPTADRLTQCDALGTGCMLIKREVLEAMQWPYFKCHERSAGGEDFYFCEQAKRLGFEVWADWSVQCQHEMRGVWHAFPDFNGIFQVGTEQEHDWETPFIVDMYPQPKTVSDAV